MLWDEIIASKLVLDCVDLNIGLNLAIEVEDTSRLDHIFQLFKDLDVQPDFVSYTTVLKVCTHIHVFEKQEFHRHPVDIKLCFSSKYRRRISGPIWKAPAIFFILKAP